MGFEKLIPSARRFRPVLGCRAIGVMVLGVLFAAAGCTSVGPKTIERDRPAYGESLADSWKDLMLLNVVKLRYADVPVFLDVTSVINQYIREGQIGINSPGWDRPNNVGPPAGSIAGRWSDRPTITYNPLTGDAFSRSLLTPIPPPAVMSLLQAGWPANFVFGVAVRSINGVHNGSRAPLFERDRDPAFEHLTQNLQMIQRDVGIGIRVMPRAEGETVLIVLPRDLEGDLGIARRRVGEILGLAPEAQELNLVYSSVAANDREVAMLTRSMLEILGEVSTLVEVPNTHITEGRTRAMPPQREDDLPITIHSGSEKPEDTYAAIEYRDHWFWIDDTDFQSKRVFTFLMIMLSLAETGSTPAAPLLTVGTGG